MTAPKRALLTLLISSILISAFTLFAWTGLFGRIEAEFYAPSLRRAAEKKLALEVSALDSCLESLNSAFLLALSQTAVKRSFATEQNPFDIFERSRILGELQTENRSLQWVRIVDLLGNRIHFSTEESDLVIRSGSTTAYRSWTEVPRHFRVTEAMANSDGGIFIEGESGRFIIYLPCYDESGEKRGVALFAVSASALEERLRAASLISDTEFVTLLSQPPGVLSGLRREADGALRETIEGIWLEGASRASVRSQGVSFALFSKSGARGVYFGLLIDEKLFVLPPALRFMILLVAGISLFMTVFWIVNIKQDAVTIVQSRMKRLSVSLLNEYFELKDDMDWRKWRRDLSLRREDVRLEITRGLGGKRKLSEGTRSYINSFFDKSWDDLVSVIGSRAAGDAERLDEEKIEDILKRILKAAQTIAAESSAPKTEPAKVQNKPSASAPPPPKSKRSRHFSVFDEDEDDEDEDEEEDGAQYEYIEEYVYEDEEGSDSEAAPCEPEALEEAPEQEEAEEEVEELEELEEAFEEDGEDSDEEDEVEWADEVEDEEEDEDYDEDDGVWDADAEEEAEEAESLDDYDDKGPEESHNLKKISEAILGEISKNARAESLAKTSEAQKADIPAASSVKEAAAPASDVEELESAALLPLEGDPFSGVDCEESKESLYSDDFSYGSFISDSKKIATAASARIIRAVEVARAEGAVAAAPPAPEPPPPPPAKAPPAPPPIIEESGAAEEAEEIEELETLEEESVQEPDWPLEEGGLELEPLAEIDAEGALAPVDNELYDVESFEEAREEDIAAEAVSVSAGGEAESPGTDINKVAMRIEFAPAKEPVDHDFDMDMIVFSPSEEIFARVSQADLIKESGGVPYINASNLSDSQSGKEDIDPKMKTLVDSVLEPQK
ncbi:MAG: hypothetical protein LBC77_01010 [Spirochaetaceae bacterium]|jgi:hypothetical protein|nr:hypothetical protein [Spirochaetaceae bacterium]